jgi:hypothetical protein
MLDTQGDKSSMAFAAMGIEVQMVLWEAGYHMGSP